MPSPWIQSSRMEVSPRSWSYPVTGLLIASLCTAAFWTSPKRPPTPVDFDPSDELWVRPLSFRSASLHSHLTASSHMSFILACARLYADISKVAVSPEVHWSQFTLRSLVSDGFNYRYPFQNLCPANVTSLLTSIDVPQFIPSNKVGAWISTQSVMNTRLRMGLICRKSRRMNQPRNQMHLSKPPSGMSCSKRPMSWRRI